jgi:hypothetical protein
MVWGLLIISGGTCASLHSWNIRDDASLPRMFSCLGSWRDKKLDGKSAAADTLVAVRSRGGKRFLKHKKWPKRSIWWILGLPE